MLSVNFLVTCLIVVLIPGTGVIFTVSTGLTAGKRASVFAALGCTAGILPHLLASVLGLSALLHTSALAFEVLRYAGVAYLLYLAYATWRDRSAFAMNDAPTATTARGLMIRGFLLNILNPKLTIFFLAFLPQFIRPADPLLPQYATVAVTAVAVDVAVMWGFFAVAAQGFRRFTRTARGQRVIDVVFGSLFLAVALLLALIH